MNETDWLMLGCLVLGWAQGLWMGWSIWRRPQLTKVIQNERTN